MNEDPEIPIPPEWPQVAKSGLMHAVALARLALFQVLSGFENGRAPKARLFSEVQRLKQRVAPLEAEIAIKDRRMAQLAPAKRPHYSPMDRRTLAPLVSLLRLAWMALRLLGRWRCRPVLARTHQAQSLQ